MNSILVSFFTKNAGLIARLIASALVAVITYAITRLGFELDAQLSGQISAGVLVLVQGFIGEVVLYYQSQTAAKQEKGIAAIQEALATVNPAMIPTGKANTYTVETVRAVAAQASGAAPATVATLEVPLNAAQAADVQTQLDAQASTAPQS